jgi:hypothetical protein
MPSNSTEQPELLLNFCHFISFSTTKSNIFIQQGDDHECYLAEGSLDFNEFFLVTAQLKLNLSGLKYSSVELAIITTIERTKQLQNLH